MKRQVALLIETSSQYGRNLLSGVVRYMRTHDQWLIYAEQSDLRSRPPRWLEEWSGDGIITRVSDPGLRSIAADLGIALVEVSDRHLDSQATIIRSNDDAIGRMAADHLLERRFSNLAYCGYEDEAWSTRRQEGFIAAAKSHVDEEVAVLNSSWHVDVELSYEDGQAALMAWLSDLKRPVGVMACNDDRGRQVIDACIRLGYTIPGDVAVIGVDNDELICRLCSPPLSSVIPSADTIGFQAAEMLAELMEGRQPSNRKQTIDPLGIALRQSTDVVAIDHGSVGSAMQYIRDNACQRISVDEVAETTQVSRSTLERQFRKHLGRTPQEEIRYVQIQRAKELLATTDLSIVQIANVCGFEHAEYLHAVFKKFASVTPGQFRKDKLKPGTADGG